MMQKGPMNFLQAAARLLLLAAAFVATPLAAAEPYFPPAEAPTYAAPPVVTYDAVPRYAYPAQPTHWMFQRSYYSHELSEEQWSDPNLPTTPWAYRTPVTGANPGFAVQSRYRVNTFVLRNGRNSFDVQVRRSGGVEIQP